MLLMLLLGADALAVAVAFAFAVVGALRWMENDFSNWQLLPSQRIGVCGSATCGPMSTTLSANGPIDSTAASSTGL